MHIITENGLLVKTLCHKMCPQKNYQLLLTATIYIYINIYIYIYIYIYAYRHTTSSSDCHSLQSDLNYIHEWSIDWGMSLNANKCKVTHLFRKSSTKTSYTYLLDSGSLECAPFITDIGVTVTCDLSWSKHIEEICAKANKTLGLIRRVSGKHMTDRVTKKLLYCSWASPRILF